MIYALMLLSLVLTMGAVDAIDAPLPLSLAEIPLLSLEQGKHHYHEAGVESLPGLTGYTRNYYDPADTAPTDDLATYGNYAHKLLAAHHHPNTDSHPHPVSSSPYPATANGFVPFYYTNQLHSHSSSHSQFAGEDEEPRRDPSANIDFVINAANYEPNSAGYEETYEGYAYRPRVSLPTPPNHYHFEQISNYRNQDHRTEEELDNSGVYARHKELQTLANPVKREQREESLSTHNQQLAGRHEPQEQRLEGRQQQQHNHQQWQQQQQQQQKQQQQQQKQQPLPYQQHVLQKPLGYIQDQRQQQRLGLAQDQQLLYSHTDSRVADLPAITTSVRHTPASSKAVAGLPLSKHIEVTKNVPVTHYQKQHVPYKQSVQVQVPRTVIAAIPKPMPIKIPVAKTVAIPQLQEVKIPIERVKPVPVERPIPFVVERRVPYRVEKPVATPVYYPYPVKVPVVRTVVHKQRTHYVAPGWSATGNHLLG
ncbi:myb-like protein AA [Drosophila serrata]|uniref:myb-like protein AA n=1 Tax=Drosophila serrata TaxID=7274 RepID=UPI000A1D123C|nr:myb-like protein AA [Drosophila serrata]